jgi:hypothetical protein
LNIVKRRRKFAPVGISIALLFSQPFVFAEDVSPECRGVAAGVVAAMRASAELSTEGEKSVAIMAARRACAAARENLGATPVSTTSVADEKPVKQEKMKLWDLLSSDQDSKPGNERLKRLRQQ